MHGGGSKMCGSACMSGVAPTAAAMPAATTTAGGASSIGAALQALAAALEQLVAMIGSGAAAGQAQLAGSEGSAALAGAAQHATGGGEAASHATHAAHQAGAGGPKQANIHRHYTGQLAADGMYHDKRHSFDPRSNAVVVNKTSDVTKMFLPRTQPEDRAAAQQFLAKVRAAAPKTEAEARAAGFVPKAGDSEHWVHAGNKADGVTGDPSRPEMLMVKDGMVTGVVFTSYGVVGGNDLPDFGLGGWHVHPHVPYAQFDPNQFIGTKMTRMQHVMFSDDLDMAFMDGQYVGDHAH